MSDSVSVLNRKAKAEYQILEAVEAGLVLTGTEVKSIKTGGKVNFADSYVKLLNGEFFLIHCHIHPYSHGTGFNHDPTRTRKLLLHRREIERLAIKLQDIGLTIVPLKLYIKKGKIKLEIGLVKGKKIHERREDIKKRDVRRDLEKSFKSSQIKL